jgi:hypothetical protein
MSAMLTQAAALHVQKLIGTCFFQNKRNFWGKVVISPR